jgi:hypothetical protein
MCLQAVIKNTACQVTLPLKKNLKSSALIKRIPKRLTGSKAILQGGSLFRGQTRDFRSDCPQLSEGGG